MAKVLDFFDNSDVKIPEDQNYDHSTSVLYDIIERSIAVESVLFAYDHLKLLKKRALVESLWIKYLLL